ncbi:MAG: EAL domain-containing protein [Solirubrobacteraceae bacterium]
MSLPSRDQLERLCMRNVLANQEERVFFKDQESRFLLVSAGWLATEGQGRSLEQVIGKTDSDIFTSAHAEASFEDERRVIETGEPIVAKVERETFADRPDVWMSTTKLPLRDDHGSIIGTWGTARDVTAQVEIEETIRRRAEGQEEIADVGRLALAGEPLEELFDYAVGAAWRVLSSDCAWLVERLDDASGLLVRAEVGWPDEQKGARIAGETESLAGYAAQSCEPIVVDDWEQERRFEGSRIRLNRGVRSSVAVLVGNPDSPFGLLEAGYTQPNAVPPDCLPFLTALANVLAEAIQSHRAQEMIRHQALYDRLTGLPNRTLFLDRVAHALARVGDQPLAVFFIDLDHFKLVNDSLGHEVGDELLRRVAPRLAGAIRHSDTLARLGGDEFAVLCELVPDEPAAARIADELMTALEEPVVLGSEEHVISVSVGIALSTSTSSATSLLRDADAAMYHAKHAGRGHSELFDRPMRDRVLARVRTESALRTALTGRREIYVQYQPLICLRNGRIVGAEALARWQHPERGPVSPDEFIPVAEESGLIHALSAQIMRQAACESAAWQHSPDFAGIAINISTCQLQQPDELAKLVSHVIATEGIAPGFITLEITESLLIEELESARRALSWLSRLGVRLSLDDFGTGYSSLSYLRDLPFDSVKIDRSLITNITDSPRAGELAAAVVHMGHALDLEVIAEGVETQQQATRLNRIGCDLAQGFYFAKPMAPELLSTLLHTQACPTPRLPGLPRTGARAAAER